MARGILTDTSVACFCIGFPWLVVLTACKIGEWQRKRFDQAIDEIAYTGWLTVPDELRTLDAVSVSGGGAQSAEGPFAHGHNTSSVRTAEQGRS